MRLARHHDCLSNTSCLSWMNLIVLEDKGLVLHLVDDRQHEVQCIMTLLLKDVSWRLAKPSLLSRVQTLHDL